MYNTSIINFNKSVFEWCQEQLFLMINANRKKQKALMAHLPPAQSQVEIIHAN